VVEIWLRELRIVLRRGSDLRRLCKFVFSNRDASLYVIPYGPTNRYAVGVGEIDAGAATVDFDVHSEALDHMPKLSIHQTGQIHADAGGQRVGPVYVPPLPAWRGAHLSTVLAENFDGLATHDGAVRTEGPTLDWAIELADGVDSAAVAVYINGREPRFDAPSVVTFQIMRPTLVEPLYIGLQPRPQPVLVAPDTGGGVIVMSGWTPRGRLVEPASFLLIRGS
jgi:hypothetical protein